MAQSNTTVEDVVLFLNQERGADLFLSDNGKPYITIYKTTRQKTYSLESRQFRDYLNMELIGKKLKASQMLKDEIIEELVSRAHANPDKKKVFIRLANCEDTIIFDLCDEEDRFLFVGKDGFSIKQYSPVPFIRPTKLEKMPQPKLIERDKFLSMFKKWFGIESKNHWLLILAFIFKCWHRDNGAYPILIIEGPHGSGKTTLSKRLKKIIDPTNPPFLSPPKTPEDIVIASVHSFLLVFDNITTLTHEISDYFCRLSTGGGYTKRQLYSDDNEVVHILFRPSIINGISEPSHQPDLLDRVLLIELDPLPNENRLSEMELETQFYNDLPYLFYGCIDLFSECLVELPSVRTTNLPRLTEYSRMGISLEKVLNLPAGEFLKTFFDNDKEKVERMLLEDELGGAIYKRFLRLVRLKDIGPQRYETDNLFLQGTATELIEKIFSEGRGKSNIGKYGPSGPRAFSIQLRKIEPALKAIGINVNRPPRGPGGIRVIRLEMTDKLYSSMKKELQDAKDTKNGASLL